MINLKDISGIFECYNFEQILDKLDEGKRYLENGEENFPIDLADSMWFLQDLEEIIKDLVYSGSSKANVLGDGYLFQSRGKENLTEKHLQDFGPKYKGLKAEMRMVLTPKNLESYLSVTKFLDTLLVVLDGKKE
jgi:hypothetical protein